MQNRPKLRFKEFNDKWKVGKIGDLFNINADGDIALKHCSTEKTDKHCYLIYANALTNNGLYGYSDLYKVSGNTLVIDLKSNLLIDYTYYYLRNWNLNILVFGSGQPLVTGGMHKKIKVKVPCLEVQEKIANILSKLDELIEEKKALLSDWQQFKKGLLQQMFV
ncbi:MAG: restriction endonuclease subunit S [Candidatus Gastranaerophilales bacterium]|nr:restriction endonuclease subunit S [Candidatus Gastranaerophilales bacterium]